MNRKRIIVAGSTNMDMVIKTSHIPVPGETVLGGSFFMNPGGKGANQAVAAARMGGDVIFISKIGNDVFGKQSFQLFDEEAINTEFLLADDDLPSGVALITVDEDGENSIVVAPGANAQLSHKDVQTALSQIEDALVLLVQLEIPMQTVESLVDHAHSKGIMVILNPAPAAALSASLLGKIDIITPNKKEASMLSGIEVSSLEDAKAAAPIIHNMGVKHVVITMGPAGAVVLTDGAFEVVPAPLVETVDSTAAGDVFNGALAVYLSEGKSLIEAVKFSCEAAAISVTRLGAQSSIPYRNEMIVRKLDIQ